MPDHENEPSPLPPRPQKGLKRWLRALKKPAGESSDPITRAVNGESAVGDFITEHERTLLSNILKLRELKVVNVMIPRADIVAVDVNTTPQELLNLLAQKQYSRIPVYNDTLDNVLGTIHLKDVVAAMARGEQLDIKKMITDIPIVSPAMTVLNLLVKMRQTSRHMALVVDEYGGIDGLVTIGNVVESIIGEIEDEHTDDEAPQMVVKDDGTIMADARLPINQFEERFGEILSDEERETSETLNGLVFTMAGRIPARGEVLTHKTGMVFEIIEADPRRIHLMLIRNIPHPTRDAAE